MLVLKEKVARAEEPRSVEIGKNQVFVVTEIFFDLGDVVFGIGITAPDGVRAVALEKRFEFERNNFSRCFRQHEVHKAFHDANVASAEIPVRPYKAR